MNLEGGLLEKAAFSILKGRSASVEDEVAPLFPDVPCCYDEHLHEEWVLGICFCLLHHRVEFLRPIPVDI
jgi:hypothetical protein